MFEGKMDFFSGRTGQISGDKICQFTRGVFLFLPAAKPTGHRTGRAVVVVVAAAAVVVVLLDYFEVMTSKVDLRSKSTNSWFFFPPFISHPKFLLGWDPPLHDQISLQGGIHRFPCIIPDRIGLNK